MCVLKGVAGLGCISIHCECYRVCHLAGKMVEALRGNCNDKDIITDDEKLCLEMAGLCHDLGHGPFSHTWERFVHAARSEDGASANWRHEEGSVQMFEYLLEQNDLRSVVVDAFPELKDGAIDFIKELIRGEGTLKGNKKYLYQIISNKDNGIDVDRWDYILRDGYQLNLGFSFDYSRLLEFCRVIEVDREKVICFRSKERHNIYDMFQVRVNLYHKAYCHNVAMAIDEMVVDAFIAADRKEYTVCVSNDRACRLSEAHSHVEALSCLTDHIFYDILYSTKEDFKEARQLLRRILRRDLYKIVACKDLSTELLNTKVTLTEAGLDIQEVKRKVSEEIKRYKQDIEMDIKQISERMKPCKFEQFKVVMKTLDMGVEIKGSHGSTAGKINPFSNIYFYDKENVKEAREMEWKEIPVLPVPEESMCHIHGLVIYKDVENPVSKNEALQKELQDFKTELNGLWRNKCTSAKKSERKNMEPVVEVNIPVPWGHVSGKWWGSHDKQPILALHGWQDNAGSFDKLAPLLSLHTSVLCIDLPGHGFSSHYPKGQFYYVWWDGLTVVRRIVKYYGWKKVTILGHSLGGSIGFLYAAAFPEDTEKLICIDIASPAVRPAMDFVQQTGRVVDQFLLYENLNDATLPSYTHDEMMKLMLEAYKGALTKESCEIMLKRGALPVTSSDCDMKGDGFCFTRDSRLKIGWLGFLSMDMALEYASKITCEVLNIRGKPGMQFNPPENYHIVLDKIRNSAKKLEFHEVEGTHFLHLNNPESICPIIVKFLKS